MRIAYLSFSYVPSRRASSVHVMSMCAAYALLGHKVWLTAKESTLGLWANSGAFEHYGLSQNFKIRKFFCPSIKGGGQIYSSQVSLWLRMNKAQIDLTHCRLLSGAQSSVDLGIPTIFEMHGVPANSKAVSDVERLARSPHLKSIVLISSALQEDLLNSGMALPWDKVIVRHDAAWDQSEQKPETPVCLGPGIHIGYVGGLYQGRGIEIVFKLAEEFPHANFHIVGGLEEDIQFWKSQQTPTNLTFHGFVPHASLRAYYQAFDVALMPYSDGPVLAHGGRDIQRWTSPMKLFEYMRDGLPILAGDLPVLSEVIEDGKTAVFARRGDIGDWAAKLSMLLDDSDLRRRLGSSARAQMLAEHTWLERASTILESSTVDTINKGLFA